MAKRVASRGPGRIVPAVYARGHLDPDPPFERGLSAHLLRAYEPPALAELYVRFRDGEGVLDALMRRGIWRALARRFGDGVTVRPGAGFRHPETTAIGDGVYIGDGALVHGRVGGRCRIGARTWIGPGCFLDARDLVIGAGVGLGPGVRIIGSAHTAEPAGVAVIATDLGSRRCASARAAISAPAR